MFKRGKNRFYQQQKVDLSDIEVHDEDGKG
jgi:hypothetical protein